MTLFYPARIQILFWWNDWRLSFTRNTGAIACVYSWFLWIGPFDIRRWRPAASTPNTKD